MKTLLTIICIIIGLALLTALLPAAIAAFFAWMFFCFDCPAIAWLTIIAGFIGQIAWIYSLLFSDGAGISSYDYGDDYSAGSKGSDDVNMSVALGAFLIGKSIGSKSK